MIELVQVKNIKNKFIVKYLNPNPSMWGAVPRVERMYKKNMRP